MSTNGIRLTYDPPSTAEERLWNVIEKQANNFGPQSYRSDLFLLLAAILAYYKARGTEPQDMISDTMLRTIDNYLEAKP